jgi:hypothetical protein
MEVPLAEVDHEKGELHLIDKLYQQEVRDLISRTGDYRYAVK